MHWLVDILSRLIRPTWTHCRLRPVKSALSNNLLISWDSSLFRVGWSPTLGSVCRLARYPTCGHFDWKVWVHRTLINTSASRIALNQDLMIIGTYIISFGSLVGQKGDRLLYIGDEFVVGRVVGYLAWDFIVNAHRHQSWMVLSIKIAVEQVGRMMMNNPYLP